MGMFNTIIVKMPLPEWPAPPINITDRTFQTKSLSPCGDQNMITEDGRLLLMADGFRKTDVELHPYDPVNFGTVQKSGNDMVVWTYLAHFDANDRCTHIECIDRQVIEVFDIKRR